MKITGQTISQVSTITHDGKVVAFGTTGDGRIVYSVKRCGFEDSALRPGAEPFAFEDWKALRLGESAPDASVTASERDGYLDPSGTQLLRSVYGGAAEVTTTTAAVQLVSALGHLCVFRQSPAGKILVSRFVLDGMANELVPRLEVRYRRSGQRLAPDGAATSSRGDNFDNLDYRDIDGKSFYEPSLELGFAGMVEGGWFAPVFLPTFEGDRFRWHLFAFDAKSQQLVIHSAGASRTVFFDVKDHLFGMPDPDDVEGTICRTIPGLTRRALDLRGLSIAGCPAVTSYDLQREQMTVAGPQLVRGAVRVMLAVPVRAAGSDAVKTAVLSFALARDGSLSQVDLSPDTSAILRSSARDVLTPLSLLDGIREVAAATPRPAGTIVATSRSERDLLQLRTAAPLPASVKRGANVRVSGTRSYDGHYKVLAADATSFQVAASFTNDEAGRFEIVPEVQTGLIFDNIVVGAERTDDGKLLVRTPSHDLRVGDEIQISGTSGYDGQFSVRVLDANQTELTLDAPYRPGVVANLSRVVRRGLRMAAGDRLETPALPLEAPDPKRDLGRTLSAWIRLDAAGNVEQSLIRDGGGLLALALGEDGRAKLSVRMSDGATHTVVDPEAVPGGAWIHFSGSLELVTASGGDTRIALCRDGVEVARETVRHGLPCHLGSQILELDGVDDGVEAPQDPPNVAGRSFSVELWMKRGRSGVQEFAFWQGTEGAPNAGLHIGFRGHDAFTFSTWGNDLDTAGTYPDGDWHHYACTFDAVTCTKRAYRDGELIGEHQSDGLYQGSGPPSIGRFNSGAYAFKGSVADVRLWDHVREPAEIVADMNRRLTGREAGLLSYWPLDNGTTRDLTPAKRHGVIKGDAAWTKATYLFPQGASTGDGPAVGGYTIGGTFTGEMAEAQIWERARPAAEVHATMHLRLTGNEPGLVAYYRMGAVSSEEQPPIVPDFSSYHADAVVHGAPHAGSRRFHRATGSGLKVIKLASAELCPVSAHGMYEESLEFRVDSPDPAFDPRHAGGPGRRLFSFAYWGKSDLGSKEILPFPPGSVQQADFVRLDDGWYLATCRVVVPDGMNLMRAFELGDLRGRWRDGDAPPADEWTAIDIRRHRIRLISGAITRETYTDTASLVTVAGQPPAVAANLADMARTELKVGRAEQLVADLVSRLDVAQNAARYTAEKATLTPKLTSLQSQRAALQSERSALVADPNTYYFKLRARHSQMVLSAGGNGLVQSVEANLDAEYFFIRPKPNSSWLGIYSRTAPTLVLWSDGAAGAWFAEGADNFQTNWFIVPVDATYVRFVNTLMNGTLQVTAGAKTNGAVVQTAPWNGAEHQQLAREQSAEMLPAIKDAVAAKDAQIASLDAQITAIQQRVDWLTLALSGGDTVAGLQTQLQAAQTGLNAARAELATKNAAVVGALIPLPPAGMPIVATDDRDLVTTGAVLDFVSPQGRVNLLESAEGNVLLGHVDAQGRLRVLPFDTALDSRNATFEQWLPDGARACADLRDAADKITLAQPLRLPSTGWTCEAWIQYPLATRPDGTAYVSNAVAAAAAPADAPLVVVRGSRLGVMADGWFFDAGVDLGRVLGVGWHHLAATMGPGGVTFYADGVRLGAVTSTFQPALRFGGAADWIEVPAHASPTAAITVSAWARSAGPTWNKSGNLAAKRDAFILHPNQGTRDVTFYVYVGGWKSVTVSVADIQGWHLYTGTFDGKTVLLYVDGELRAQLALTGAIAADSGVMIIGSDDAAASATNGPLAADVAEVAVWNVARTSDEVRQDLYRPLRGDEAGLVGYWRMAPATDGGVLRVKDLTANARHGVVKGAPTDVGLAAQRAMDVRVLGNLGAGQSPIGRLAEVRLWGACLTADEVAACACTVPSGNEPALLGWFPLSEGAGTAAANRAADAQIHGTTVGVDWVGSTAPIGNPGAQVLSLSDRGGGFAAVAPIALAGKSFTVECWGRRSGGNMGVYVAMVGAGTVNALNQILWLGFTNQNKLLLAFNGNDCESSMAVTDTDWHHFCGTYDQPTRKQRLWLDGVLVGERVAPADYTGTSSLLIGKTEVAGSFFSGMIAEVRIWDRARTEAEIRAGMRVRAGGAEAGLLACYPLDEVTGDRKIREKKTRQLVGQLQGSAQVVLTTSLAATGADSVAAAEYSAVDLGADGTKQAILRRALVWAAGGVAQVVAEQRVEELTLQWVGNTQINPTLLGYIEGAPPVPSENLTQEEDYDGATAVALKQSEQTGYRWQRSEASSSTFNLQTFLGVSWEVEGGFGIQTKLSDGKVGAALNYECGRADTNDTAVTATSSLMTSDSLALTGIPERGERFPAIGSRWIPKNVGYALVISGMADVFVTKLKRGGRMVSYDIRPVDGVPLDVNTITFMLNPAYVLQGTLDGQIGGSAADDVFYPHVPAMRSQHGSLYPASFYRVREAYALKEAIERQDKERESFFYNFSADQLGSLDTSAPSAGVTVGGAGGRPSDAQQQEAQAEADRRQADIAVRNTELKNRIRAGAAFADWQVRMEGIQTRAGKRNVVNTYVWDGDGGLRTEEQSFASTIEHTISTASNESAAAGLSSEVMVAGVRADLSLMFSAAKVSATSKTLSTARSLELTVDLAGVEKDYITDLNDNPRLPGEKVDRYRFMTFYLEGSTDHFNDFFRYVVDPVWLSGNDEEARALRQARGARPNKCWRVMHRVTYVERPVLLKGIGQDARPLNVVQQTTPNPLARQAELVARMDGLEAKLDEILLKLASS